MASATFDVESYTVGILHGGDQHPGGLSSSLVRRWRTVYGRVPSVHFYDDDPERLGFVTNVDQLNFNGHSIYTVEGKILPFGMTCFVMRHR